MGIYKCLYKKKTPIRFAIVSIITITLIIIGVISYQNLVVQQGKDKNFLQWQLTRAKDLVHEKTDYNKSIALAKEVYNQTTDKKLQLEAQQNYYDGIPSRKVH